MKRISLKNLNLLTDKAEQEKIFLQMKKLTKLANTYGFTQIEMKVFLFVVVMFILGTSYKFLIIERTEENILFDYSEEDSTFNSIKNKFAETPDSNKINNPNIDYKQEVLDFNDADFNSNSKAKEKKIGRVNLNDANISQLIALPGIGQKTAERIIEYRKARGKFSSKSEILNVKGIGSAKFEKLKDLIFIENEK